jgi:hypothetical protein
VKNDVIEIRALARQHGDPDATQRCWERLLKNRETLIELDMDAAARVLSHGLREDLGLIGEGVSGLQ